MQTFDQSLMGLFRQNLIAYEEALRQCSNPDDFALRVSGISGTSDTTWDDFEGQKGDGKAAAAQPAGGGRPAAPVRTTPANGSKPPPAGAKPGAGGAKPASPSDDDFQIERF